MQDLAAANVARRVQALEALADLLAQASAAARTETIATGLAGLAAIHADLLAGVGETAPALGLPDEPAGGETGDPSAEAGSTGCLSACQFPSWHPDPPAEAAASHDAAS